jgi:hypothetical protein
LRFIYDIPFERKDVGVVPFFMASDILRTFPDVIAAKGDVESDTGIVNFGWILSVGPTFCWGAFSFFVSGANAVVVPSPNGFVVVAVGRAGAVVDVAGGVSVTGAVAGTVVPGACPGVIDGMDQI